MLRAPGLSLLVLCTALGCSAAPPTPPPPPTCFVAIPSEPAAPRNSPCACPAASRAAPQRLANRCFPNGRPAPAPTPAAPARRSEHCRTLDPNAVRAVEADLRKRFSTVRNPARIIVDFDCDPTTAHLQEIHVESGVGHGWSLLLWRIRPLSDSAGYDVLGLKYEINGPSNEYNPDMRVLIGRGQLASTAAPVVERSRTALAARIHALPLRPADPTHHRFPTRTRSDIHYLLRVTDTDGAALEGHFTDYISLQDQGVRDVLEAAAQPLIALLERIPLQEQAAGDDEKGFFVRSFRAAWQGDPAWWVRERYLSLASKLGTRDLLPELLAVAGARLPPDGYSEARQQLQAINAIATITGWDLRFDADGKPRPPETVAAEYVEECED